ncbi:lantibiotic dehydratase [Kitasatospora kifunensis]|uniref:Thiopeptide-type bacteriocin biosynthesis protein n=1 Tax=Kitasatospora kifunensis TaxID=58351 RepID=A0A7W7VY26_KITKI|nr:lantibiotic dehydratase [Kitasatospora kifunensis]MBB4926205.1 thiopeptide-type bacteriocin biosynthesis protein [Kitasatospora kifunensis]
MPDRITLYQHSGAALLRAAVAPMTSTPDHWPNLSDTKACYDWLRTAWSRPGTADAVRDASCALADRIDTIGQGGGSPKQVRRATVSLTRYLLRSTGRPTPFGLFAGVARATTGSASRVRWGSDHRPVARVDTQWLASIVDAMEACPELLERLAVVFNNLASQRGHRLQIPSGGPNRVSIRHSTVVRSVREMAESPVVFGDLADKLAESLRTDRVKVATLLTELVQQGFLITCLRAPLTVTDPLAHVIDRLTRAGAADLPDVAAPLHGIEAVRDDLLRHNDRAGSGRAEIAHRMRDMSHAGRTPLAVDLELDCDVQVPSHVAGELERAADALVRLTRQPTGDPVWQDYLTAFWERYSTGTLVPLTDLLDPATGLGYPADYPGSTMAPPTRPASERDARLLALAWQAMADDTREIVLTDEKITALTAGSRFDESRIPPHVEMAARIHATSTQTLDSGEYTLSIAPARSAGTLTSRFTTAATGSGLAEVYQAVPTAVEGALPAQLTFPPLYPHAENVVRIPAYLPHIISLGEHRPAQDAQNIPVDDLAVTATRDRLHLVSVSRRRVVEPQVFHALALDKQTSPIARFLAHLPRAFTASWTGFDWGPLAMRLPYLPRVRYGRAILSPARWFLTAADLPDFDRWRERWRCPATVELRDDDRTLRLTLTEPIHLEILRAHLARHGDALLTETAEPDHYGWIGGHAHEIAMPLAAIGPAEPQTLAWPLSQTHPREHGPLPGAPEARWLNVKIPTHPERFGEIITLYLPRLLAALDEPPSWFIRYRSAHESDHLRLRLRAPEPDRLGEYLQVLARWAQVMRSAGVAGGLLFDAYRPENGRYGEGPAMDAAEAVFVADSKVAAAQLRYIAPALIRPTALVAVNMLDITNGFLGPDGLLDWLSERPVPGTVVDRETANQAVRLAFSRGMEDLPGWAGIADARRARTEALAAYRRQLPEHMDAGSVLECLLHMHHNRMVGINSDSETAARYLARQAARACRAQAGARP